MAQHDQVISDGPGAQVRADMNAAFAAIFSSSSGPTEPLVKKAGQLWFDTTLGVLNLRDPTNGAWQPMPIAANVYTKAQTDAAIAASTPRWARPRNHIINPACQVSQENANTASASAATQTTPYYAADQWGVLWSLTGTANAQRKQSADSGSDYVSLNIVTATPTPASSARAEIAQDIEGLQVKEFNWFTDGGGKDAVLRFNFYASVAGIYTAFIRGPSWSYFVNFTASVGWKVYSFAIPAPAGSTASTWPKDNTKCMTVGVGLASGAGFQAIGSGWQQTNQACQAPGASNGAATAGASFGLTDVGLYLDPDKTGGAPPFNVPDYEDDLVKCRRYWWCSNPITPKGSGIGTLSGHSGTANVICFGTWRFTVPMRIAPPFTIWNNGVQNQVRVTLTGAVINTGNPGTNYLSSEGGCLVGVTSLAASQWIDFDMTVNARM